jgi:hypothetical protein
MQNSTINITAYSDTGSIMIEYLNLRCGLISNRIAKSVFSLVLIRLAEIDYLTHAFPHRRIQGVRDSRFLPGSWAKIRRVNAIGFDESKDSAWPDRFVYYGVKNL